MKKLIIVGAGISGLYLASLLEDKYEITILEARQRVGGRILNIDGHDMGPSWIWPHQKNILALLKLYNIDTFAQYDKGYALFDTKDKVETFSYPQSQLSLRIEGSLSLLINKILSSLKNTNIIYNERVVVLEELENKVLVKTNTNLHKSDKVILTLPPRLVANLTCKPPINKQHLAKLNQTQTWMGNSAKCVIEFKSSFWKDKQLSGFVFSHLGPLSEIHDASTKDKAALFGFVSSQVNMENFDSDLKSQLKRVFSIEEEDILNTYLVDWREEPFTSDKKDTYPLNEHPSYGIDITHFNKKIMFSSTEFANKEGGYIEGAIIRAQEIAQNLTIN